jgi:hypothetical protein
MLIEIYHKVLCISYTTLSVDTMARKGVYCGLGMYLVWEIMKVPNNF